MKKNMKFYGSMVIMLALYLIISNLPVVEPLTLMGLRTLALLVACVWGWCTMGMSLPSFIAFVGMGFITGTGAMGSFMNGLGAGVVVMMAIFLMISGMMVYTGFTRTIALKLVGAKFANGKPWIIIAMLLVVGAVLSLVLPGMAVVLVIWDLAEGIFESCGYERGEKAPKVILIGICSACTFGMMCSHVSSGVAPNVVMLQQIDPTIVWSPLVYTGTSLMMLAIFLVCNMLLIRFVFKPDVEKLRNYKATGEEIRFTVDQKIAGFILLGFVLLVTIPAFMPKGPARTFLEGKWGLIGFGALAMIVALSIRHKDGTPFITFKAIEKTSLSWELIFMIAAITVLCGNMSKPEYGIADWLTALISPIINKLGPFWAVALLLAFCVIVTNFLDSAIARLSFMVVAIAIAHSLNLNGMGLQALIGKAAAYGMFLPGCSPLLTMLYAREPDGWIDSKEILKEAWPQVVMAIVIIVCIGYIQMDWFPS